MLEASQYADNAFITLTYSEETLPSSGTLMPEHLTLFLKRLRTTITPVRVRYYAVGEYGDESQRPHYHLALFGFRGCHRGQSRMGMFPRMVTPKNQCCPSCNLISALWHDENKTNYGGIFIGQLEPESAGYIAGYVTKKLTDKNDPRLYGRHPEFARMSTKPGLGADAMFDVADVLLSLPASDDVPSSLRHGSRTLPLGNYLRRKLRTYVGKDEKAPQSTIDKVASEVLPLLKTSIENKEAIPLSKIVSRVDDQKVLNMDGRHKIKRGKKTL